MKKAQNQMNNSTCSLNEKVGCNAEYNHKRFDSGMSQGDMKELSHGDIKDVNNSSRIKEEIRSSSDY